MTKQEKKRLSSVLRATEYLFLENIALKLVLEHREVPNWRKLLDHLLADKEMLAGVRLKLGTCTTKLRVLPTRQVLWTRSWENCLHRRSRISLKTEWHD
jgi:hypothetical protein